MGLNVQNNLMAQALLVDWISSRTTTHQRMEELGKRIQTQNIECEDKTYILNHLKYKFFKLTDKILELNDKHAYFCFPN